MLFVLRESGVQMLTVTRYSVGWIEVDPSVSLFFLVLVHIGHHLTLARSSHRDMRLYAQDSAMLALCVFYMSHRINTCPPLSLSYLTQRSMEFRNATQISSIMGSMHVCFVFGGERCTYK